MSGTRRGESLSAPDGGQAAVARTRQDAGARHGAAMRTHELLPHTADMGFTVAAPTLRALFEEAAVALAKVAADEVPRPGGPVGDQAASASQIVEEIALESPDVASLMVGWLNELIGLGEVRRAVVREASLSRVVTRPAARLRGSARFEPYADGRRRPRIAVKSATFHGLSVRHGRSGWEARVYLDV